MVHCLLESLHWLINGFDTLHAECVRGITANADHCHHLATHSIGIVTALKPYIGYANCTEVAKEALETGGSVYQMVLEKKLLTKEQLDKILDPQHMIQPVRIEI
jgi:aspartate ammonia-lyase